ncbi:MAG TPA: hypothetical protein PLJ32_02330 [Kiritimatiellia bacterium]|jgi:hypothetical protein|nr:hypothetical protein [Kiritimatiellia bacterium]
MNRKRDALISITVAMGVAACCFAEFESGCPEYAPELKDRCWMWGHKTGQYDQPNGWFRIPVSPDVTMAEACRYMGIPNVSIVIWHIPDEKFMSEFTDMKRVAWVVDNGDLHLHGRDILPEFLAFGEKKMKTMPNLMGFEFDDFFDQPRKPVRKEKLADGTEVNVLPGSRTLEELRALRKRLHSYDRPIDMRLVFYERDLDHPEETKAVVDIFDTVMFWTWFGKNVQALENNFKAYRKIAPKKPTLLGIYMWDFGGSQPLDATSMKLQLDFALKLFRAGEVEGFIFHCTPLVNKNIEAVELARRWIIEHGNEKHGGGEQRVPPIPEPPALRPEQTMTDFGRLAFEEGKKPNGALLLTGPGKIRIVERTGRIAWENVAQANPEKAFYHGGHVYFEEDGIQKRIRYSLPCDRLAKAEVVPEAQRAQVPKNKKFDSALLDCLKDRSGYSGAMNLQR